VKKKAKFGIGIGVIIVAMGFLAWLGYGESKTYYHTIAELQTLQGRALKQRMRVGGTVAPNSIHRYSGRVEGSPGSDGRFVAEHVQAKCASKYEAAPGATGGAAASSTQHSGT
jgi:cytochrome c-type biogenesis protein CcmE